MPDPPRALSSRSSAPRRSVVSAVARASTTPATPATAAGPIRAVGATVACRAAARSRWPGSRDVVERSERPVAASSAVAVGPVRNAATSCLTPASRSARSTPVSTGSRQKSRVLRPQRPRAPRSSPPITAAVCQLLMSGSLSERSRQARPVHGRSAQYGSAGSVTV